MRAVLLLAFVGCTHRQLTPAPTASSPQALRCATLADNVHVDGLPDDRGWNQTPVTHLLPAFGQSTGEARCLRTRDGLAVYVTGPDTHLTATVAEHDGRTWDDDVFEVFVQPDTGEHYYEFHVTPAGTTLDMRLPAAEGVDARTTNDPVFHQLSAVSLTGTLNDDVADTGWSAEFVIPWADIGGPPDEGAQWTGHVARYDYAADGTYALASTAPFTEVGFHRRHEWPPIVF